jgi:hypothetical protein
MKEIRSVVLVLFALIVLPGAQSPRRGPSTGGDGLDVDGNTVSTPLEAGKGHIIVEPLTSPRSTTTILMDYYHGILEDYGCYPQWHYTTLIALLEAQGHAVVPSNQGILNLNLDDYGVIVLNFCWSASPYSADEVQALESFVDGGGGLLIIGDADACTLCHEGNSNLSVVSIALAGVTLGISTVAPTDLYFSNFQPHQIFSGIDQLYYRYAGGLGVVAPGVELAYTDSGSEVLVAGHGRIIVVGDSGWVSDNYWGYADDQLFVENIFDWLSSGRSFDSFLPVVLKNVQY